MGVNKRHGTVNLKNGGMEIEASEIERLINKISGVISSKLCVNDNSDIEEIHIVSNMSRGPKQIVRDIESIVAAAYGLQLDHRLISVAQIDDDMHATGGDMHATGGDMHATGSDMHATGGDTHATGSDMHATGGDTHATGSCGMRLQIDNVQVTAHGRKISVKVILSHEGNIYEGCASGANSVSSRPHIVVQAALTAVHAYLNEDCIFSLVDVQRITIAARDSYLAAIGFINDSGDEILTGSSTVKHDEYHAIIRATLDAINRRLAKMCSRNVK